jgi:O-antigen/teichoic acid export membrane protein
MIPALSGFRARGQTDQIRRWLGHFISYSWWLNCLGVLAVWLLADWAVPLVFGSEFAPAAASLKWISLAMPLAALLWAGNILATVIGLGRVKFGASMIALLVFTATAMWLTPLYAAAGTAGALSLAVAANVAVLAVYLRPYFRFR